MTCPSVVYDVGLSKKMAIDSAKALAEKKGKQAGCSKYVGNSQAQQFRK